MTETSKQVLWLTYYKDVFVRVLITILYDWLDMIRKFLILTGRRRLATDIKFMERVLL